MAERNEAGALRMVVVFLRFHADMTQAEFGKASRVDQSEISKYEKGTKMPTEESLLRMARVANVEWPVVVHLRRAYGAVLSGPAYRSLISEQPSLLALLEPMLLAITPYLLEDERMETQRQPPEEERREAEEIWTALERCSIPRRRRLIELAPRASRSSALAASACAASLREARDARESLELAELALSIAERVEGEEDLRSRAQGYCWAHVGNARRLGKDLGGANEAFARARDLWRPGTDAAVELFPEWRLLSLEALLRRAQRRLPEALESLRRARAILDERIQK
jgi:transcriptional regulator with XRE-family HTH domain